MTAVQRIAISRLARTLALGMCLYVPAGNLAAQPAQWWARGIGGGGALYSPSFSPHEPGELYIACDMSELFHTTNQGSSWRLLPFTQIQGGPFARVQFTNNPQVLYCIDARQDLMTPVKSTDGGTTWQPLAGEPTQGETWSLHVDPDNGNRILLADYRRLYFSNNGGTSFTSKYSTAGGNGCHLAGVLFAGENIYVATSEGLLISRDGGNRFELANVSGIPAGHALLSCAGAQQNGTTRLYALTAEAGDVYAGITGSDYWGTAKGVFVWEEGAGSWTARLNGINLEQDFPMFIAAARNDLHTVYLAGGSASGDPLVMKSSDGGGTWAHVFKTDNNRNIITGWSGHGGDRGWGYGECALGFAVAPNQSSRLALTDYGFIHLSDDGGSTWRQAYLDARDQNTMNAPTPKGKNYRSIGLENTSCWWLVWSGASHLFAGFSDIRGLRSTDGGQSWSFAYTGHTDNSMYHLVRHPATGVLYAATATVHDVYQSTHLTDARLDGGGGKVIFSHDQGATWQTLHDFGRPVVWLALDPGNGDRLYASVVHSTAGGIFATSNLRDEAASTWAKLANPPRSEGHPFNIHVLNDGTLVCTYSGRRNAAGQFTPSSGVFVSSDQGKSWEDRSDAGMRYWTKDLVIYPHDATQNTWYVGVFSGWGGAPNGLGGLYRTLNRGLSWQKITAHDRVTSVAFHPHFAGEAYLTTEQEGLWHSSHVRAAAPVFRQVANYPFRQPERVFFNPYRPEEVWLTSFGHGLRTGTVTTTAVGSSDEAPWRFELAQNHPNPFNPHTTIRYSLPGPARVRLRLFDVAGREVARRELGVQPGGRHAVEVEGSTLVSGVYLYQLEAGDFRAVGRMTLIK